MMQEVVDFGCSMGTASAAAAVTAFAIGGRSRWAFLLAAAVLLFGAGAAALLLYFLWYDPMILRLRMDRWSFERLQHAAPLWAEQIAGYHGPLGAAMGIAFGTPAGLLMRLERQWPRQRRTETRPQPGFVRRTDLEPLNLLSSSTRRSASGKIVATTRNTNGEAI